MHCALGGFMRQTTTVLSLFALAAALPAGASPPAFQVSTAQVGTYPAVAGSNVSDRFMVVWQGDDGDGVGIVARIVSSGAPQGTDFVVNASTANSQFMGDVAWNPGANRWVVVWQPFINGGFVQEILAKQYDSTPNVVVSDYLVNDDLGTNQYTQRWPRVAAGGIFGEAIVWEDLGLATPSVVAEWGESAGFSSSDFLVHTDPGGEWSVYPAAAVVNSGLGTLISVWRTDTALLGRRFTAPGTGGPVFQVNTNPLAPAGGIRPKVEAAPAGNFVVVWMDYDTSGFDAEIMARRYDAAGAPVAMPFQVNTFVSSARQRDPEVAVDGVGNAMVVWEDEGRSTIRARRYNAAGTPVGPDFPVAVPGFNQHFSHPDVGVDGAGNILVVWDQAHGGGDGSPKGIFAKRYQFCASDADGDGHCGTDDSCPAVYNPDQHDTDGSGGGDVCDSCPASVSCNVANSGSATIGSGGGSLARGRVSMTVPAGAVGEDTSFSITGLLGSEYGLGAGMPVLDVVTLGPEGTIFNPLVTLTFAWPDNDSDGVVDGIMPAIAERNLVVYRNGTAVTRACSDPACDTSVCPTAAGCGIGPLASVVGVCCSQAFNVWSVPTYQFSEFTVAEELCPPEPLPLVETAGSLLYNKGTLVLKDNADDTKDTLVWKGNTGPLFTSNLGNPTADDGTDYALCFYDRSGPVPVLIARAAMQAGGTCDPLATKPCWKAKGATGFSYGRKDGSPEGVTNMKLTVKDGLSGKVQVKGKGVSLTTASRYLPLPAPPLPLPLVVDLVNKDGLALRSEFTAVTVQKNEPGNFKARSDFPSP